ncbi:MAG: rhomboid family intramembrane serine protease [Tannerella sp.]|jgi:membrane associated rhomboid family serine protease|nr:rhomboid family intramembrane serine protease [Tannerella sp.]
MAGIFTEINRRFSAGSIPARFIYINVGVFILIKLLMIILRLFMKEASFLEYIEAPSSPTLLVRRPWTIITYMFVHFDFLHILFNMLWLYWFGQIFLMFFTGRQLGGLYLLGGIAGAAFFLITYNSFPLLKQFAANSFLAGASASVMAIVFAASFYRKNFTINLLLIGRVKLIYLAIGVLLLDILAITSENAGGHIAHIGGALLGILFAVQYQKGKDITGFINKIIDRFVNFITHKPTFRTYRTNKHFSQHKKQDTGDRSETDDEYLRRRNEENRMIDEILDKLKRSGYESLSAEEKKKLFDASRK